MDVFIKVYIFASGYEVAKDFNPFMQDLTQKLQKVMQLSIVSSLNSNDYHLFYLAFLGNVIL